MLIYVNKTLGIVKFLMLLITLAEHLGNNFTQNIKFRFIPNTVQVRDNTFNLGRKLTILYGIALKKKPKHQRDINENNGDVKIRKIFRKSDCQWHK